MSSRAAFWASTLREVKFVLYTFNNHSFLYESKQKWGKFLMIKKQKIILLIDDFHFTIQHYSYLRQRRRITSVPYWLPSCRHVLWRRGWTSWLPIEYCSFLRRPSSKRRYPCLNFWLKSRWEAWTGVELSKMTSAFFSVCRWEKNHEKQVQNLQFRSERSLSLTFRDRVKTNQGEIFFINKTGQNIFIFLKWSHLRMVVRF